jgi:SurA-like protein
MNQARCAALLLILAGCIAAPAPQPAPTSLAASATPDPARPLPLPLPEVVARINGQPILIRQILPIAKTALDKWQGPEREEHKPEALRQALSHYIDRELLLQEAISRGVKADTAKVDWSYDQMRREHASQEAWESFLLRQGLDEQSFKAELRAQHTVAALLDDESQRSIVSEKDARSVYDSNPMAFAKDGASEPPSFESVRPNVDAALRQSKLEEIQKALLARLRARAKIEVFL